MRIQRENVSNITILPEFFTLLVCVDKPERKPGDRANSISLKSVSVLEEKELISLCFS